MLFNEDELKELKLFSDMAIIANLLYEQNKDEYFYLESTGYEEYPVDNFFHDFKHIFTVLDLSLIQSGFVLSDMKKAISEINSKFFDLLSITHLSKYDSLLLFVKNLILFLDKSYTVKVGDNSEDRITLYTIGEELYNFFQKIKRIVLTSRGVTIEKEYLNKIIIMEDQINKIQERMKKQDEILENGVSIFLEPSKDKLLKQASELIKNFQIELGTMQGEVVYKIREKIQEIDITVKDIDKDIKLTVKDYEILKKLINAKGEQQITDHYKKRAFWERITYWLMTIGTFAIIIWSICLALNGLDEYKAKTNISITTMVQQYKDQPVDKIEKMYSVIQSNALTYLVLRLIFSVLLFSSIIYTSRVAYRAYVHMRHSENMMLKLATLRPFINQLEEDDRNQIHKDLVPDYFGKDAGMVDSTNEKFKDLPANVSAVAMKAIEQISGSGSNSSTEKNGKKPEGGTE